MLPFPPMPGVEPMAVEGLANMPYAMPALHVDCVIKDTHVPIKFLALRRQFAERLRAGKLYRRIGPCRQTGSLSVSTQAIGGQARFSACAGCRRGEKRLGYSLPAGRGRGIAIHEAFGTIVAQVIEVAVSAKGDVKVERVVAAVDCGNVVNPLTVEMQIESGVIYGLTAALYDEITIKDGRIQQGNFDDYPMVRMADAPKIETHLALSGGDKWGGIGEPERHRAHRLCAMRFSPRPETHSILAGKVGGFVGPRMSGARRFRTGQWEKAIR